MRGAADSASRTRASYPICAPRPKCRAAWTPSPSAGSGGPDSNMGARASVNAPDGRASARLRGEGCALPFIQRGRSGPPPPAFPSLAPSRSRCGPRPPSASGIWAIRRARLHASGNPSTEEHLHPLSSGVMRAECPSSTLRSQHQVGTGVSTRVPNTANCDKSPLRLPQSSWGPSRLYISLSWALRAHPGPELCSPTT